MAPPSRRCAAAPHAERFASPPLPNAAASTSRNPFVTTRAMHCSINPFRRNGVAAQQRGDVYGAAPSWHNSRNRP